MSQIEKVVIITGASRGIGAGLVQAYLERGFRVVATAQAMAASTDERVLALSGDIRQRETATAIVAAAKARFGRIDTLVNNAGVFIAKPFLEYTQDDFDTVMGVNVAGFFYLTQRVATEMLARRAGHIVNITATVADQPRASAPSTLASLSKGGAAAATKSLAIEFAKHGIRVNAVAPGVVATPMHPASAQQDLAKLQPVGRMTEVKDITDAVLYLESAPLVTGETIHVDGGSHAGQG